MNKNIKYSQNFLTSGKVLNQIIKQLNLKEASCITVGLFDTDSGVKRCEHGARSAECLQRAA